jgi:hypothetical protein
MGSAMLQPSPVATAPEFNQVFRVDSSSAFSAATVPTGGIRPELALMRVSATSLTLWLVPGAGA